MIESPIHSCYWNTRLLRVSSGSLCARRGILLSNSCWFYHFIHCRRIFSQRSLQKCGKWLRQFSWNRLRSGLQVSNFPWQVFHSLLPPRLLFGLCVMARKFWCADQIRAITAPRIPYKKIPALATEMLVEFKAHFPTTGYGTYENETNAQTTQQFQ